jgi:hypothetical protein
MTLESLVSNPIIWSVTKMSSIIILEALFIIICEVYSTGIAYEDLKLIVNSWSYMFIVQATGVS